ncbi:hypothetical protein YSY43_21760 [Paenibacillus sp. YSY-4.3]
MSFGIIEDGITEDMLSLNDDLLNSKRVGQYVDFVKEVSGFSLGSIVLFDFLKIRDFQNLLEFLPNWETEWLCIGKIMAEPLGINMKDGKVYWFSEIPYSDEGINLGSFFDFLKEYVFGYKYSNGLKKMNGINF